MLQYFGEKKYFLSMKTQKKSSQKLLIICPKFLFSVLARLPKPAQNLFFCTNCKFVQRLICLLICAYYCGGMWQANAIVWRERTTWQELQIQELCPAKISLRKTKEFYRLFSPQYYFLDVQFLWHLVVTSVLKSFWANLKKSTFLSNLLGLRNFHQFQSALNNSLMRMYLMNVN